MRRKKSLAVIAMLGIALITFTTFYFEHLSYIHNYESWPGVRKEDDDVVARILFVADPQIIGEKNSNFLYGWAARWDADWYLQKNYQLAKDHVSPNVIVFLGDLFDEGSTAQSPEEYLRYVQRFESIFEPPTNMNPSMINYIFIPGDNDVGGEKREPVNPVKVKWFKKVFGDFRSVVSLAEKGAVIQFVKMNLFMPSEYLDPRRAFQLVINGTKRPDIRLILSHTPLLDFETDSVEQEQALEAFQPKLIVSAHSHNSTYLRARRVPTGQKMSVHIIHDFLVPGKASYAPPSEDPQTLLEDDPLLLDRSSIRLNLKSSVGGGVIHEILVPTCSYRMGVLHMGYGSMQIYKNGTMEYTVLWLPSRFKQLYFYLVVYLLAKILLMRSMLWKGFTFLHRKCYDWRWGLRLKCRSLMKAHQRRKQKDAAKN